ncbi:MAG: hypothetical protein ACJ741_15845 [Pyrinomonadaceae bacterium]
MKIPRRFPTAHVAVALALLCALAARAPATRALLAPAPAASARQAQEKYRVFCVNGKVDFGSRTLEEMRWDFGKNVCVLHEYDSYREAKDDARRRGGVGAECHCQS